MALLREISGYVAHALLLVYWAWVLCCTAPQLRRSKRGRALKVRVLLVKTAAIVLTALLVGVIHFWATHVWQVALAVPVAAVIGIALRRYHRTLVAAPKHQLTLIARAQRRGRRRAAEPVEAPARDVPAPALKPLAP